MQSAASFSGCFRVSEIDANRLNPLRGVRALLEKHDEGTDREAIADPRSALAEGASVQRAIPVSAYVKRIDEQRASMKAALDSVRARHKARHDAKLNTYDAAQAFYSTYRAADIKIDADEFTQAEVEALIFGALIDAHNNGADLTKQELRDLGITYTQIDLCFGNARRQFSRWHNAKAQTRI